MFEKTVSFWRRWLGGDNAPAAAQQDRRLWIRYPTSVEGHVQPATQDATEKLPATICDLSRGGANLLVERPFEPGQMIRVELPALLDEIRTVLACVVRVGVRDDGKWAVGCVFSRELSEEELNLFAADKHEASGANQRKWVRFACAMQASYRKVGDPSKQSHPAEVLNISANGIGLAVTPPLETGSLLNVDLQDKEGKVVRTILACVAHATTHQNNKDGPAQLAVGCNFIRQIDEAELQALL